MGTFASVMCRMLSRAVSSRGFKHQFVTMGLKGGSIGVPLYLGSQ